MRSSSSTALTTKFYLGDQLNDLLSQKNKGLLDQIIQCYIEVFNESWGEKWDYESASNEITSSFKNNKSRIPLAVFLFDKSRVVGFAWAIITDIIHIESEKDMPFNILKGEKNDGVDSLKFWMKIWGKKSILVFREMGVLKSYRGGHALSLFLPIIKSARENNCDYINYWTSPESATFKLGLSIGFWPIKIFNKNDLILLMGNMNYVFSLLKKYKSRNILSKIEFKGRLRGNIIKY